MQIRFRKVAATRPVVLLPSLLAPHFMATELTSLTACSSEHMLILNAAFLSKASLAAPIHEPEFAPEMKPTCRSELNEVHDLSGEL